MVRTCSFESNSSCHIADFSRASRISYDLQAKLKDSRPCFRALLKLAVFHEVVNGGSLLETSHLGVDVLAAARYNY